MTTTRRVLDDVEETRKIRADEATMRQVLLLYPAAAPLQICTTFRDIDCERYPVVERVRVACLAAWRRDAAIAPPPPSDEEARYAVARFRRATSWADILDAFAFADGHGRVSMRRSIRDEEELCAVFSYYERVLTAIFERTPLPDEGRSEVEGFAVKAARDAVSDIVTTIASAVCCDLSPERIMLLVGWSLRLHTPESLPPLPDQTPPPPPEPKKD